MLFTNMQIKSKKSDESDKSEFRQNALGIGADTGQCG